MCTCGYFDFCFPLVDTLGVFALNILRTDYTIFFSEVTINSLNICAVRHPSPDAFFLCCQSQRLGPGVQPSLQPW